jgi:hypothetical protein
MMKIMMRIMNMILPTCKEVSHLTSQAMDETLPWSKRLGMRLHLMMCVWCRRNSEQLQLVRDLARKQSASQSEEAKLSSDARDRLSKLLEQNDDKL